MNCKQFENRIQQLLDERSSLTLDLPVQQHARDCDHCRYALSVYDCIAELPRDDSSPLVYADRAVVSADRAVEKGWNRRQRRAVRYRMVLGAAAMLVISLVLVAQPPAPRPVAVLETAPPSVEEPAMVGTTPVEMDASIISSLDLRGFIPSLPDASYVDITSISRIDIGALMPEQPVKAVQSIPATFESIQPVIYRYSNELPVVNQWSSGINYTIGLIQNSLPSSTSSSSATDDDLGSKKSVTRPDIC